MEEGLMSKSEAVLAFYSLFYFFILQPFSILSFCDYASECYTRKVTNWYKSPNCKISNV